MKLPENFEERLRYEYPLTRDSLVIDCGGYHGQFAAEINRRYGCKIIVFEPVFFEECRASLKDCANVTLIPAAAGTTHSEVMEFGVQGDRTGAFNGVEERKLVTVVPLSTYIPEAGCDLLKLNVEGMEYQILEYLLNNDLVAKIRNIQVQFHQVDSSSVARHAQIRQRLLTTHELTFDFPFVWENYRLREPFQSNSQAHQDEFAWRMNQERTNGFFVDIGAGDPKAINNTWALEKMGWSGLLAEIDVHCICRLKGLRDADLYEVDMTGEAAEKLWAQAPAVVDYLSFDIDIATLPALKRIPFDRIKFRVITIEHDAYRFGPEIRQEMRAIIARHGYQLVCKDVTHQGCEFEDWWVHPELVPEEVWKPYVSVGRRGEDPL